MGLRKDRKGVVVVRLNGRPVTCLDTEHWCCVMMPFTERMVGGARGLGTRYHVTSTHCQPVRNMKLPNDFAESALSQYRSLVDSGEWQKMADLVIGVSRSIGHDIDGADDSDDGDNSADGDDGGDDINDEDCGVDGEDCDDDDHGDIGDDGDDEDGGRDGDDGGHSDGGRDGDDNSDGSEKGTRVMGESKPNSSTARGSHMADQEAYMEESEVSDIAAGVQALRAIKRKRTRNDSKDYCLPSNQFEGLASQSPTNVTQQLSPPKICDC